MQAREIRRFAGGLVFIGYTLWMPAAAIMVGIAGCGALSILQSAISLDPVGVPELAAVGIAGVAILAVYAVAIPALIVGLLLTRRRSIWRCSSCGYAYDRT